MAEQKEFESLDELFRKTFDNLPDTPAKSGWDAPSERVWQHVQEQIKPPKSGWSTQTIALLAAFAVTLTVGLYLLLNRPVQPETPAATQSPVVAETAEQPSEVSPMAKTTEDLAVAQSETLSPAKSSGKQVLSGKETILEKEPKTEAAETTLEDSVFDETQKPSAKKAPPSPNTKKRREAELAQRAEEAWKTPLQPLPSRWPGKPE